MPLSHFLAFDSSSYKERALVIRRGVQFRSLDKSIVVTPNADNRARTTALNTQANRNTPTQGAKVITSAAKAWIAIMNRAITTASNSVFICVAFLCSLIIPR